MTRSTATANNAHAAISVVIKVLTKRLLAEGKRKKAKGKSEERPRAPAAFDLSPPPPTTFTPPRFFCLLPFYFCLHVARAVPLVPRVTLQTRRRAAALTTKVTRKSTSPSSIR